MASLSGAPILHVFSLNQSIVRKTGWVGIEWAGSNRIWEISS